MFRFRFETVLRVRQIRENMARQEMARAQLELQALQQERVTAERDQAEYSRGLMERMRGGLPAAEVRACRDYLAHLEGRMDTLGERIAAAQQVQEERRRDLLAAAKDCKAMQRLKDIQRERHTARERKLEMQFIDEVALAGQRNRS